jgi:hypothetical protein
LPLAENKKPLNGPHWVVNGTLSTPDGRRVYFPVSYLPPSREATVSARASHSG